MDKDIKVIFLNIHENPQKQTIATFGCYIPLLDLYLNKLRIVKKGDGTFFVSYPNEEFIDPKTGKKDWNNFYWFGKKLSKHFQEQIKKAIDSYCYEKNIKNPMY